MNLVVMKSLAVVVVCGVLCRDGLVADAKGKGSLVVPIPQQGVMKYTDNRPAAIVPAP